MTDTHLAGGRRVELTDSINYLITHTVTVGQIIVSQSHVSWRTKRIFERRNVASARIGADRSISQWSVAHFSHSNTPTRHCVATKTLIILSVKIRTVKSRNYAIMCERIICILDRFAVFFETHDSQFGF